MPASTIVDQHGRPFEVAAMQEEQTARIAMLQRDWATHPAKGLTPARLASILQDAEQGQPMAQLDLADDMLERDGHVFAELDKRAAVVVATQHEIAPPPGATAAEQALAEEVAEWVEELPLAQIKRAAMDAVLKSVSAQEMRWGMQGKLFLPVSIEARPTRWLCPDERGMRWHLRDGATAYGQPLLPGCWLLHRHRSLNGYMTRDGLVRVLAWPHLFKWASDTDLMEIMEILGIPMRIGVYPTGASAEEKSRLMQAVVSLGRNAAGIMPAGMKIDLIKGAEGTEGPYVSMAQRMEAIQSKVIVGQTLTSGEGQHGTQALGAVHNEVRMDIRDADLAQLAVTLTQQLIWPMVAQNKPGIDPKRAPRWRWLTDQADDIQTFAENLPKLAAAGMRISVAWAHDRLKIPMASDTEAVLGGNDGITQGVKVVGSPPAPAPSASAAARAALPTAPAPGPRDVLDDVIEAELTHWKPLMAPLVQPLLEEIDKVVASGESLESLRARMAQIAKRMDAAPLGAAIARAGQKGAVLGAADANLSSPGA